MRNYEKDGDTSRNQNCHIFDNGHILNFDSSASGADKTVYSCVCGATVVEHEDAGTGA